MSNINNEPDIIPQNNININQESSQKLNNKTKSIKTPDKEKENENEKEKKPQTISESIIDEDLEYEQIKNSRFKQQRLPAWRPVPTILSIIITFSAFGVAFIVIGLFILIYAKKIKIEEIDYTNCGEIGQNCSISITIKEDIPKPIFVYYQLDGFFQNARRYIKSKQIDQLTGDDPEAHDNCAPAETNEEMGFADTKLSIDKTPLVKSQIAIPCGLFAKTYFNDTFEFFINGNDLTVDETNIAFEKDRKLYDKNPDPKRQWINITDEHFLVWMRPSGLPDPRKLWGKIDKDLNKNDIITIKITNNYDVSYYEGKKKIFLSNTNNFGGKNTFLGICYIVVGGLSLISAIFFLIGYKIQMKKEKEL